MRRRIVAALALAAAGSLQAQTPPAVPNLGAVPPIAGSWAWAPTADGSEASFVSATAGVQATIHCARATRRVTIAKAASAAASYLGVWTSSASRSVPATFNAATSRLSADLAATDPLLDAMASSRGTIGFSTAGAPSLVVPAWPEVARVVEDCRV